MRYLLYGHKGIGQFTWERNGVIPIVYLYETTADLVDVEIANVNKRGYSIKTITSSICYTEHAVSGDILVQDNTIYRAIPSYKIYEYITPSELLGLLQYFSQRRAAYSKKPKNSLGIYDSSYISQEDRFGLILNREYTGILEHTKYQNELLTYINDVIFIKEESIKSNKLLLTGYKTSKSKFLFLDLTTNSPRELELTVNWALKHSDKIYNKIAYTPTTNGANVTVNGKTYTLSKRELSKAERINKNIEEPTFLFITKNKLLPHREIEVSYDGNVIAIFGGEVVLPEFIRSIGEAAVGMQEYNDMSLVINDNIEAVHKFFLYDYCKNTTFSNMVIVYNGRNSDIAQNILDGVDIYIHNSYAVFNTTTTRVIINSDIYKSYNWCTKSILNLIHIGKLRVYPYKSHKEQ